MKYGEDGCVLRFERIATMGAAQKSIWVYLRRTLALPCFAPRILLLSSVFSCLSSSLTFFK